MKNLLDFELFFNSLTDTNKHLDYFVDFKKCYQNAKKLELHLNTLNYLLGKNDLLKEIEFLFSQKQDQCFVSLPILIAVRDSKTEFLTQNNSPTTFNEFLTTPNNIFDFMKDSGLITIFSDKNIKNLNDYVFGVEVGLDTNARKNRSGKIMEKYLSDLFAKNDIEFKAEVYSDAFDELKDIFGVDRKRFDFVVYGKNKFYLVEANFYSVAGSKPNETDRSYILLASKLENVKNFDYVWITDGKGWNGSKNRLAEAYKSVEMYNLNNIADFIKKVKNG